MSDRTPRFEPAEIEAERQAAWIERGDFDAPVPEVVAGDGDTEGADRGDRVVEAEVAGEEREDPEIDQITGAADEAELEQLQPVVRVAGGGADPHCERFGGVALRGHGSGR